MTLRAIPGPCRRSPARFDLAVAWLCVLVAAGPLRAAPARPAALTGDDQILWIVVSDWDPETGRTLNWIARVDPSSLAVTPLLMPAQLGQVKASATVDGALHLFLANEGGSPLKTAHYSFAITGGDRRELRLPEDALPAALAGDKAGLWAIVDGLTAEKVNTAWCKYLEDRRRDELSATSEGESAAREPANAVESRPFDLQADHPYVVKYDGLVWQPAFAAPPNLTLDGEVWLAVEGEKHHAFWCPAGARDVSYAVRKGASWASGPAVSFARRPARAYAGILNKQLVFVGLSAGTGGSELHAEPF
ncbi:MAG: hypothetical protein HRF43_15350, partial [Phycisphaerae bacterium]